MKTQYVELPVNILKDSRLNSDEKIAIALIMDRMKSSKQRAEFYDDKFQEHYVIYSIVELATTLGIGKNTAIKVLKHLEVAELIFKRRMFNQATRIFLAKPDKPENKLPKAPNVNSNQLNFNQKTKYTDDTNDTSDAQKLNDEQQKIKQGEVDALADSLITQGSMPKRLVSLLKVYSFGDYKKLYEYAGVIYKAKNYVYQEAKRQLPNNLAYRALRFEFNDLLEMTLVKKIKNIIVNANRKASNVFGYIMQSLITIFEEQSNEYLMRTC
ncbi:hypothetical protein [Apilactobacillus ozensis]|uniref:hypothetical protein n=1 Tax=Apilactobacillus ozensis TaxID=866801 RepID=UPI002009EF91|nr:hypothetical protein [Apilactobacillus ozensis]MCK8607688.1 hypothetical protein [Apilactobacillus ozensis]